MSGKMLAVLLAALAFLVACMGDGDGDGGPSQGDSAIDTASRITGGGAEEPVYEVPVRVTEGEYRPPVANEEAFARGLAAAQAAEGKPAFTGVVNGFQVYPTSEVARYRRYCGGGVLQEFPLVDTLTFTYLPPGTFARTPQYAGKCADGSVPFVAQNFVGGAFTLSVVYQPGEPVVDTDASADRVSAGTAGGRPGIVIRPVTPEGFGISTVAFATTKGFIVVRAQNLPLSETQKIAEGVQCASC
jgi:hypothetical protein